MHRGRRGRSVRAQSSVIGIVLIIGLTLAAASAVVVFGSATLEDGQQRSQIGQAEQAMTQFDSRAAQVALGGSRSQSIQFGPSSGNYWINPDSGHVTITHVNYSSGSNQTIHEGPLGALMYTLGDTEIAYQGGGVWKRNEGAATMISSPEFHYRDATLTFPIITVDGDGTASGDVTARVSRSSPPSPVFPRDETYNGSSDKMSNPITNGTMRVTIQSKYCQGWKKYFETRTEGNVTDCSNGNVSADIYSLGTQGGFPIANEPELSLRGVDNLRSFKLEFRVDQEGAGQSSGFNNFDWSMNAEEGDQRFEINLNNNGGGNLCPDEGLSEPVDMEMRYSDDGGDSFETWQNNEDFTIVCDGDEPLLVVDLLSPDITLTNEADNETSVRNRTRYYVEQMGDMDLDIREGNSAGISDTSSGTITYDGDGRVITFLHVTENEVKIELN